MIVSLPQINFPIRHCINFWKLVLFGHGDTIYCHRGELIQGHILLTPILKLHQENPLTRESLNHTSKLLPQPPGKYFHDLILQLT